jgi:two-component system, LytTR family, response regulator LytT
MKIVIIEDEKITADDLAATIKTIEPEAEIIATLSSVKSAVSYMETHTAPDLIFSDVQLGDGLSFEIFKAVKITSPVIFCTAYDEYALNAFKTNSIDYILKPSTSESIAEALEKYKILRQTFSGNENPYKAIIELLSNKETPKSAAVLVHYKDKIMPVRLDDIALFYLENEITYLITFDQKNYSVNKNMEDLELIAGKNFFRANRQCLVSRKTIIDASHYFSRKLSVNISVPFKEKITVSKEKTPLFLNWLENQ